MDLSGRLLPPHKSHWMGTDELGRDLLVRLCHAARFTLVVAVGATALALGTGFILGSIAAWYGGWIDVIIVTLINLFWSIPFVVFAVLLIAVVGASPLTLILCISGVNWVSSARVFRSEMLRLRRSDFIIAARAAGYRPWEIFLIHVIPNLRTAGIGLLGYGAAETLTLESGLAFLGLSLPPPLPTWGGLMSDGLAYFSTAWWIAGIPAVSIVITLASLRTVARSIGQLPKIS